MTAAAPPVLWEPSRERAKQTTMWRFLQANGFAEYEAAWRWSIAEPEAFWTAVSDFFAVRWDVAPARFLAGPLPRRRADARRGVVPRRASLLRRTRLP